MKSGHFATGALLLLLGLIVWLTDGLTPSAPPVQPSGGSVTSRPSIDAPQAGPSPSLRIDRTPPNAVVSATPSAPALTLVGHLESLIVSNEPPKKLPSPASAANWVDGARFNPQRKVLSAPMMAQLDAIAASYNERMLQLLVRDSELSNEACLLAVRQGQIHSAVARTAGAGESPEVVARENAKAVDDIKSDLAGRLGKETVDWSCRQIASRDPDGMLRSHIVYYMRHQAEDHFATKQSLVQLVRDVHRQVRDLIGSAP